MSLCSWQQPRHPQGRSGAGGVNRTSSPGAAALFAETCKSCFELKKSSISWASLDLHVFVVVRAYLASQRPRLLQIRRCLRNKQWDTRIAASVCLGLTAVHFTHHGVITLAEKAEQNPTVIEIKPEPTEGAMTFQTFDICQVLQQGIVLVASGGQASLNM